MRRTITTNDRKKYEYFYGLISRHKALIENLCMRRASGDESYCAELRQECYIAIWRHEEPIRTSTSPRQESFWIYWICRSAFSQLRYLQRTQLHIPIDELLSDTLADTDDHTPVNDHIESLSSVLNAHERQAVRLMAEGYTPKEMAQELGIKHRSAVQLRYRIISKLRKHAQTENH